MTLGEVDGFCVIVVRAWREGDDVRARVLYEQPPGERRSKTAGTIDEVSRVVAEVLEGWLADER